jgi:hypothetical protein
MGCKTAINESIEADHRARWIFTVEPPQIILSEMLGRWKTNSEEFRIFFEVVFSTIGTPNFHFQAGSRPVVLSTFLHQ